MEGKTYKPYSAPRWWDNPMGITSLCCSCKFYMSTGECIKYGCEVPREVLLKSFPGTSHYEENYCSYREEKPADHKAD